MKIETKIESEHRLHQRVKQRIKDDDFIIIIFKFYLLHIF